MAIRAYSWKSVVALLAGLVCASGHTMPVVELDADTKRINLSPVLEYYRDSTGELGLDQVRRLAPGEWQSSSTTDISFGFTDATYWFRVQLRPADTMPMLVQIGYPSFDHVEMFQVNETGVRQVKTGSKVPLKERTIQSHFPLLPLQVNKDQPADLYLKASNTGSFYLPIRLWDWSAYIMAGSAALLSNGVYFGAWLVVIIFNLVLFAVLRQRALLSLSVFIFSFGLYQISSLGLGSAFIASMPSLHDDIVIFSVGIAIISLGWLADHLLELEHTNPLARRFIQVIAALTAGLMIAYLFLPYQTIVPYLAALTIPNAVVVLYAGLHSAISGNRLGLYATLAWSTLLLGTVIHSLTRFAVLPTHTITEQAPATGFIIMILILSLAIAAEIRRQRINLMTEEQRAREEERQRNLELELMVKERTAELESALKELSDANDTLKELNTVDAVTGIKNRQFFDETFEQEWRRAARGRYVLSILLLDIDNFKIVNDTYGHLAGDECLRDIARIIGSHLKRPGDILARYGGEEFVILLPYITNENACYLAEQIRADIESANIADLVNVTISIGVCSVVPDESVDRSDLINAADMALYEAKNAGRNLVRNADSLPPDPSRSAG